MPASEFGTARPGSLSRITFRQGLPLPDPVARRNPGQGRDLWGDIDRRPTLIGGVLVDDRGDLLDERAVGALQVLQVVLRVDQFGYVGHEADPVPP